MVRPRLVYGHRPFWWRLVLVALIAGALLVMLSWPSSQVSISLDMPPGPGGAPAKAPDIDVALIVRIFTYVLDAIVAAVALVAAWVIIHFERKRRREAAQAFD
jgi:hypothetical protein